MHSCTMFSAACCTLAVLPPLKVQCCQCAQKRAEAAADVAARACLAMTKCAPAAASAAACARSCARTRSQLAPAALRLQVAWAARRKLAALALAGSPPASPAAAHFQIRVTALPAISPAAWPGCQLLVQSPSRRLSQPVPAVAAISGATIAATPILTVRCHGYSTVGSSGGRTAAARLTLL